MHQSGKQIVLTSDTAPKDLEGMQERLLSRFRWGLNADVQAPSFETRQEILKVKMGIEGIDIPEDVVKYIAYNVPSNVRELEGALIALLAQAMLNKKEIDIELAKRVMKNFIKTASKELSIENIQKMKNAGILTRFVLLRTPLSKAESIVKNADISLNTEIKTLKNLSHHAKGQNKTHQVIIMVELGDLREGILPCDLPQFIRETLSLSHIKIIGIGCNLACSNGIGCNLVCSDRTNTY